MWNSIVLGWTSLLTDISSEMTYPLLPLFLGTLGGVTAGTIGLIVGVVEGVGESMASIIKLVSGRRADRTGRRKPLTIAGYASATLSKALFVGAASWPTVLIGRVIDRFGKGVRTVPRDALLADAASPQQHGRVFGLYRFFDTLGALLGVVFAFLLLPASNVAPRLAFSAIFGFALIPASLAVGLLLVHERADQRIAMDRTAPVAPRDPTQPPRRSLLASWHFLLAASRRWRGGWYAHCAARHAARRIIYRQGIISMINHSSESVAPVHIRRIAIGVAIADLPHTGQQRLAAQRLVERSGTGPDRRRDRVLADLVKRPSVDRLACDRLQG